ncbi:MAG: NAD(+)/NADH kinase [Rikenellaceae bacterium]
MKIALFSRHRVEHKKDEVERIFSAIERHGFEYCVNEEFAEVVEQLIGCSIAPSQRYGSTTGELPPEAVMVCYGGDGTILEGLYRLSGRSVPIVGINSGRLGFLASGRGEIIEELFDDIANNRLKIERRSMIEIEGEFAPKECSAGRLFAANELSVQRLGATMISVETIVDGEAVATYYGDGVVLSTPTGSTAYSLSAGGPIVAPNCACFIISPLASHNLSMRPLVIPNTSTIEMNIYSREGDAAISLDNRTYPIGHQTKLTISLSKNKFLLATASNISFYETLRKKMMWGVDLRNCEL